MTKVDKPKEWWLEKARAEGDATVLAGGAQVSEAKRPTKEQIEAMAKDIVDFGCEYDRQFRKLPDPPGTLYCQHGYPLPAGCGKD